MYSLISTGYSYGSEARTYKHHQSGIFLLRSQQAYIESSSNMPLTERSYHGLAITSNLAAADTDTIRGS